jgi:hypothetical protein
VVPEFCGQVIPTLGCGLSICGFRVHSNLL